MRTDQEIFRQILKYVGKHRKFIFLSLFAGALCSGCGVAGSELLKRVIDGLSAGTLTDIVRIVLMCVGILVAGSGAAWITRYASGSVATKVLQDVKDDAAAHITGVTAEYMAKNRSGDILSRLTDDVNRISNFVQDDLIFVMMNPCLLFFILFICCISIRHCF